MKEAYKRNKGTDAPLRSVDIASDSLCRKWNAISLKLQSQQVAHLNSAFLLKHLFDLCRLVAVRCCTEQQHARLGIYGLPTYVR